MIPESVWGQLSVLSVGDGDMKFTFDSDDPQETERARRCIEDMLRRVYLIFVEVDGALVRSQKFDADTNSYVIADGPLYAGDQADPKLSPAEPALRPKKGKRGVRRVPARGTRATAVAPTAGG